VAETPSPQDTPRSVGRYTLHREIASGGMATVYFGRLAGPIGFSRIVAVKRMHPRLAKDPDFVAMFVDEARLASRVTHPNVVATLDIVIDDGELFIVMDYVRGQSLSGLLTAAIRAGAPVPVPVATAIMSGVLAGLHAAHDARDKHGAPLGIVHRDVSPHNVLVGTDGVARIMDFGVAKAERKLHVAPEGEVVGKPSYMAPEQILGEAVDRRTDVFAAGVVLWSMLAGRRLFRGEDHSILNDVLHGEIPPLASFRGDVPPALEAAIRHALERDPARRPASARDLATEIETAAPLASATVVGAWVESLSAPVLGEREALIAQIEDTGTLVGREALLEVSAVASRARSREAGPTPTSAPAATAAPGLADGHEPTDAAVTRLMHTPSEPRGASGARSPLAVVMAAGAALAAIVLAALFVTMRTGGPEPDAPGAAAGPTGLASAPLPGALAPSTEAPTAASQSPSVTPAPASPGSTMGATGAAATGAAAGTTGAAAGTAGAAAPGSLAKPGRKPASKKPPAKPGDDLGFIPPTNR
jgi:hypothetical protein